MLNEARELLAFAASYLQKPVPSDIPDIQINPDLECAAKITWSFLGTVIELKHWRDGNLLDHGHLLHELCHHIQRENDMPMHYDGVDEAEVEAITAQLRWLQAHGVDPRTAISQAAIIKMTRSEEFAKLEWL